MRAASSAVAAPASERELLDRAAALAGLTLAQIASRLGLECPADNRRTKGWTGRAMELCLGATAGSLPTPDFEAIGVELKTIPINERGRPAESTFVCMVALGEGRERWESSLVRRKLARVLWVPVESARSVAPAARRIGNPLLWRPSAEEDKLLRDDWEELTEMIALGELDAIGARHGRVLQIRPKAANARSLTRTIDGDGSPSQTLPRGFYLRATFTAQILGTSK